MPCRLVQSFKPARELASGISYVSLSRLGWRKLSCAWQRARPCAVDRRGPDGAAGGDRRGAAHRSGQTCSPKAGRSLVRPDAGEAAFGDPRAGRVANRGHHAERGARAALPGANRPDGDDDQSQPVGQPAGGYCGRRAA